MGDPEENNDSVRASGYSHKRETNGELHEHRRRSDDINGRSNGGGGMTKFYSHGFWVCITIIMCLIGAWAANGVNHNEMNTAIAAHGNVTTKELEGIRKQLDTMTKNQDVVSDKLESVRIDVGSLKVQVEKMSRR